MAQEIWEKLEKCEWCESFYRSNFPKQFLKAFSECEVLSHHQTEVIEFYVTHGYDSQNGIEISFSSDGTFIGFVKEILSTILKSCSSL